MLSVKMFFQSDPNKSSATGAFNLFAKNSASSFFTEILISSDVPSCILFNNT